MIEQVVFRASPSLALVKYWGKADSRLNTPATPSIGATLAELHSETVARVSKGEDRVTVDGAIEEQKRFAFYFKHLRSALRTELEFDVESTNSFPTAAGLASSASGFAAMTCACAKLAGFTGDRKALSAIARVGSASAARSLYGGFVGLDAGAEYAEPLFDTDHWPDFRIVVVAVTTEKKPISSRAAMERSKVTSPFFPQWVEMSPRIYQEAKTAIQNRDIERLGALMRMSYLAMFSTMFSSDPPVIYWRPGSLSVIHLCEELRRNGIAAWETMDAGPQVKIACVRENVRKIVEALHVQDPQWQTFVASVGSGPVESAPRDPGTGL